GADPARPRRPAAAGAHEQPEEAVGAAGVRHRDRRAPAVARGAQSAQPEVLGHEAGQARTPAGQARVTARKGGRRGLTGRRRQDGSDGGPEDREPPPADQGKAPEESVETPLQGRVQALPRTVDADDAALIAAVLEGSEGAFATLVQRYQDRVFRLLSRYTRDSNECEDLAQEVFLKVVRKLHT